MLHLLSFKFLSKVEMYYSIKLACQVEGGIPSKKKVEGGIIYDTQIINLCL